MPQFEKSLPPICDVNSGEYEKPFYLEIKPPHDNYFIKFTPCGRFKMSKFHDGHNYNKPININKTCIIKFLGFSENKRLSECQYRYFSFNDNSFRIHYIGSCTTDMLAHNLAESSKCILSTFSGSGSTTLYDIFCNLNSNNEGNITNPYILDLCKFLKPNIVIQPCIDDSLLKHPFLLKKEKDSLEYFIENIYQLTNSKLCVIGFCRLTKPYFKNINTFSKEELCSLMEENIINEKIEDIYKEIQLKYKDKIIYFSISSYVKKLIVEEKLDYKLLIRDCAHLADYGMCIINDIILNKIFKVDREKYKNTLPSYIDSQLVFKINDENFISYE